MIADFWFHKFKALGFPPKTADLFAYSIECKSEQLEKHAPDKLAQYLRDESEKRPDNFVTLPFNELRKQKDLLELLGRKPLKPE